MQNDFVGLTKVSAQFARLNAPYLVAGGWAIDLAIGKRTRDHGNFDFCIERNWMGDVLLGFHDWEIDVATPSGEWKPCLRLGDTFAPRHRLLFRKGDEGFQLFLVDRVYQWIGFAYGVDIMFPRRRFRRRSKDGGPYIAPELNLLYKSKSWRDEIHNADFQNVLPTLDEEARIWLKSALGQYVPDCGWIKALER